MPHTKEDNLSLTIMLLWHARLLQGRSGSVLCYGHNELLLIVRENLGGWRQ